MTTLRQAVQDYLSLRRSLGFKLRCVGALLLKFAAFAEARGAGYVTISLALEWATLPPHQKPATWADRMKAIRVFARYQQAIDARTEVPPFGLLPYRPPRARPYLYTAEEIRRLLEATARLRSTKGIRPHTYYCLLGLLAVWACASARLWHCGIRTPISNEESSPSGAASSKSRGSSRFIPPRSTPCATTHSSAIRSFVPATASPFSSPISGARWKSPRFAGPSTNSLAGPVCGREKSTAGRVSMTFVIGSPSRR